MLIKSYQEQSEEITDICSIKRCINQHDVTLVDYLELLKYEKEQIQNEKKENIKFKKINQNKTKKLLKGQNKINEIEESKKALIQKEDENKKEEKNSNIFCLISSSFFLLFNI